MVLRLNTLFIIYILPENTGPYCNYKIIGEGTGGPSASPHPASSDAPETVKPFMSSSKIW